MAVHPAPAPPAVMPTGQGYAPAPLTSQWRNQAVEALAAAFASDPLILWMSRHPEFPHTAFDQVIDPYLRAGVNFVVRDDARVLGAVLGVPLGTPKPGADLGPSLLALLLRKYGLGAMLRGVWYELYSVTFQPKEPHAYVYAIGVRPEAQGQGLGTRLLAAFLHAVQADQVPAFLESANERNLTLYQRMGFRIVRETRVPLGGPRMWLLWREPQPIAP